MISGMVGFSRPTEIKALRRTRPTTVTVIAFPMHILAAVQFSQKCLSEKSGGSGGWQPPRKSEAVRFCYIFFSNVLLAHSPVTLELSPAIGLAGPSRKPMRGRASML